MVKRDVNDRRPLWTSVGEINAQWRAGRRNGIILTLVIQLAFVFAACLAIRYFY